VGIRIGADEDGPPWPCDVFLEFACDGDHGLFPPPPVRFAGDNFVAKYSEAMRLGWKVIHAADGRRLFLGPCCSGKAV
jgi:hypothetical protein